MGFYLHSTRHDILLLWTKPKYSFILTILLHFTNTGRSIDLTADSVNLQLNRLQSKRMKCFPWKSQSTLLNVAMNPFPTPRDCIVYLCLIPPFMFVCCILAIVALFFILLCMVST